MNEWLVMFQYSGTRVGFDASYPDEKAVRKAARKWLGVKRLPRGTRVWRSSTSSEELLTPYQMELFRMG